MPRIAYSFKKKLSDQLKSCEMSVLDFKGNTLSIGNIKELAEILEDNRTVKKLNLIGCKIGIQGVKLLAKALEVNEGIKILNLNYNDLCDEGAQCLANALKMNETITRLHLGGNNITDDTIIDDILRYGRIKYMYVQHNYMDIAYLLSSLNYYSLFHLDLSGNSIGTDYGIYIGDSIKKNPEIKSLNLEHCNLQRLGEDTVGFITRALVSNTKLKYINFGFNNVGMENFYEIFEVLAKNSTILEIELNEVYIPKRMLGYLRQALSWNREYQDYKSYVVRKYLHSKIYEIGIVDIISRYLDISEYSTISEEPDIVRKLKILNNVLIEFWH